MAHQCNAYCRPAEKIHCAVFWSRERGFDMVDQIRAEFERMFDLVAFAPAWEAQLEPPYNRPGRRKITETATGKRIDLPPKAASAWLVTYRHRE